jgi:hypothetical protein
VVDHGLTVSGVLVRERQMPKCDTSESNLCKNLNK